MCAGEEPNWNAMKNWAREEDSLEGGWEDYKISEWI